MRKLVALFVGIAGTTIAAPAMADTFRPQQEREARPACADRDDCAERRAARVWFYRGHDENARPQRRVVRRVALEN